MGQGTGWQYIRQTDIEKAIRDCESVYTPPTEKYTITVGKKKKPKRYSFDDTGNAEHFCDLFGGNVRYNYTDKAWMWYDGRRWKYDDSGEPKRMVDEMLSIMQSPEESELYLDDEGELQKKYQAHIKRSRSSSAKTAALKESEHLVPVTSDALDLNPYTSIRRPVCWIFGQVCLKSTILTCICQKSATQNTAKSWIHRYGMGFYNRFSAGMSK